MSWLFQPLLLVEAGAATSDTVGSAGGVGAASATSQYLLERTASASGIGAASAVGETPTVFIGTATVLGNDNSPGNKTFSANGGTNLPPCLFVCGFLTATSDDPSVFQIGATNLVKVANDSINFLQLWAADYAGGSDTITVGDGSVYDEINVAPGWATAGFSPTAVSPQSETYGTGNASAAAHRILSPNCEIPTGGVGFVVGGTTHFAKAAGTPNWANCETSPAPSNGYAVDYARISLACKATAGSWQPEFWGSGASDYTDNAGLVACAFASTAGVPSGADGAAAGAGAASGVGAEITILRPDGDTALDGWTDQADGTSNIYQSIDETSASDADYVQSPAAAAAAPFALDGSVALNGSSATLALPALSTTYGNDIIYVAVITNGGPVTSITSSGLTWTMRAVNTIDAVTDVELWYAKSASPLSSHVITVNTTGAAYTTACAFAFSGANYASPFDGNAAIPDVTGEDETVTFTTSNADDVLVAMRLGGGATPPTDFTQVTGVDFLTVVYRIVTATQSAYAVAGGSWAATAAIGDAIKKA